MIQSYIYIKNNAAGIKKVIITGSLLYSMFACGHVTEEETETTSRAVVRVTHAVLKDTVLYHELPGISQFTQHIRIRAFSTGIITQSFVVYGSKVTCGQPLFVIRNREALALKGSTENDQLISGMADTVYAFSTGIIEEVASQTGDFVQEGDILADCVSGQSMRVVVSVPMEGGNIPAPGTHCFIVLPDGNELHGHFEGTLPTANDNEQTYQYLVFPETTAHLAENVHVPVFFEAQTIMNGFFVPKSSVIANEELTRFWVMKVIHDTLAIAIPVNTGIETDSIIQLTGNSLDTSDVIISSGGYALPDSSVVSIIKAK